MTNNRLSIHNESVNIFYQNFNTNESFYRFLLTQQDEDKTKAIIPKSIPYHYSFEKYTEKSLPSYSIDNAEKIDPYANKDSKYLFQKFNHHIEGLGGEKQIIRHAAKEKNLINLKKIDKRETENVSLKK